MNYHNISYPDMLNGEGLRVVLWLSGCSHQCKECQNPQTWNPNSGIEFDEQAEDELYRELSKDYISGLTLTGGDPLCETNLDPVLNLLKKIRILFGNTKTVWLYTGYTLEEILNYEEQCNISDDYGYCIMITNYEYEKRKEIIELCDVLVDGRFEADKIDLSLPFRGSSNQRLININADLTIKSGEISLWNNK